MRKIIKTREIGICVNTDDTSHSPPPEWFLLQKKIIDRNVTINSRSEFYSNNTSKTLREIHRLLCNLTGPHRVRNNTPHPKIHSFTPTSSKTVFNILPSIPRSLKWSSPFRFRDIRLQRCIGFLL
jgi:hypothetical protein